MSTEEDIECFQDYLKTIPQPSPENAMPFLLGKSVCGSEWADLEDFPHLIISGAMGSGKSTLAHSIILSLVHQMPPDKLKLILCDSKLVEFNAYKGIPHLLVPVITDIKKASVALLWVQTEVTRRLRLLMDHRVRSFQAYNEKMSEQALPYIVVVLDDAATITDSNDSKQMISTIAQNGRTVGVHLVLVTQSPGDNAIEEIVKYQVPVRAVFSTYVKSDIRLLLGNTKRSVNFDIGHFLFYRVDIRMMQPIQTFPISNSDIDFVIKPVINQFEQNYDQNVISSVEKYAHKTNNANIHNDPKVDSYDEMLPAAVDVMLETGQASVSMIQRRLMLGYVRAARILDEMEEKGIVGPFRGSQPREILITKEKWNSYKSSNSLRDETTNSEDINEDIVNLGNPEQIKVGKREDFMERVCPKCGSTNVDYQIYQETEGSTTITKTKSKYKQKGHGCLWWLFIGWWWWIIDLTIWIVAFIPRLLIQIFKKKKYVGSGTSATTTKNIVRYKSICLCKDCGHHWEV